MRTKSKGLLHTKKMHFRVHRKVHTRPNLLTLDNLNKGSQIFHLKLFINYGHLKLTMTNVVHKNA